MCLTCLKRNLVSIEGYEKDTIEFLEKTTCECCRSFPNFLRELNNDLKLLCLTKMKKYDENTCSHQLEKVKEFEGMVKNKIRFRLNAVMEQLDGAKEEIKEGAYLKKCSELKELNDFVEVLDKADDNGGHNDDEEEEEEADDNDNDYVEEHSIALSLTINRPDGLIICFDNTQMEEVVSADKRIVLVIHRAKEPLFIPVPFNGEPITNETCCEAVVNSEYVCEGHHSFLEGFHKLSGEWEGFYQVFFGS